MNKLRVFQKVNQRRTVQMRSLRGSCTVFLLFFFLPYLLSVLWGNQQSAQEASTLDKRLQSGDKKVINQTALGREEIPLEIYVADKLARSMNADSEKEALKAQAVLIRTNLVRGSGKDIYVEDEEYGITGIKTIYREAVAETKGMILVYEGEPVYGAYFRSSAGSSRNASESMLYQAYPYLNGVPCSKDYLAEGSISVVSYSKENFWRLWEQIPRLSGEKIKELSGLVTENQSEDFCYIRDSAGYVTALGYRGEWAEGETVRYALSLSSSNFQITEEENQFVLEVTGEGHGFGMSQFTANEMAKEGKDFLSVINYFFQGTELTKIER